MVGILGSIVNGGDQVHSSAGTVSSLQSPQTSEPMAAPSEWVPSEVANIPASPAKVIPMGVIPLEEDDLIEL